MTKSLVATFGAVALSLGLAACGDDDGDAAADPATQDQETDAQPEDEGEASDFPEDDIRFVVTYAAGGPTDVAGRAVADYLAQEFDISVIVENVEGASGAVGTAEVARAEADGYTIGMTTASAASRVPLIEDVGYQLEDIEPLGVATYGPGIVIVREDSPYESIDDLVEAAEANPGEITIATAGTASPQHVELVRMQQDFDVPFQAVPFEGEAPAVTALLGENTVGCFCSTSQTTMAQIEAGEFRVLATGSPDTLPSMPDVPTLAESGFDTIIYGNSYFILVAPAGTPDDVVARLESALQAALEDPDTLEIIGEERLPAEFMGREPLMEMMQEEQEALGPVLQELFSE